MRTSVAQPGTLWKDREGPPLLQEGRSAARRVVTHRLPPLLASASDGLLGRLWQELPKQAASSTASPRAEVPPAGQHTAVFVRPPGGAGEAGLGWPGLAPRADEGAEKGGRGHQSRASVPVPGPLQPEAPQRRALSGPSPVGPARSLPGEREGGWGRGPGTAPSQGEELAG